MKVPHYISKKVTWPPMTFDPDTYVFDPHDLTFHLIKSENLVSFENMKPNWNQTWFSRCDIGTFKCSWDQRSNTKDKCHLLSICKISWKCENGINWKVEVSLESNLVYIIMWGPLYIHAVKGHKSRSQVLWGQLVR